MRYDNLPERKLEVENAIYMAAFIDGEGSIGLWRRVKPETGELSYRPIIEVSNTNLGGIQWFADTIGNGWMKCTNPGNVERKGHRPLYRFRFRTQDLRWLIPQIRPYLKIKGRQADILLDYFARVTNTRPSIEQRVELDPMWAEMRGLNQRGISESVS